VSTGKRFGNSSAGIVFIVATGILWGTIGIAAKLIYQRTNLDPVAITWLRALIATPVCVGMAWKGLGRRLFHATKRDWTAMTLLGLILIAYQFSYLVGVDHLGVSTATLISLCVPPVLVAIVSVLFFNEKLGPRFAAALIGAIVGLLLLVGTGSHAAVRGSMTLGVLGALGSATGIATHALLSRNLAGRQPALRPLAIAFPVGAVAFAPIAAWKGIHYDISLTGWLLLLYLGIGPSALAYVMFQRGLKDVPATTASIVTLLEPLVAAILAWAMFDERLGLWGWLGAALLIGAIATLSLSARPRPAVELAAEPAIESAFGD
jgi:DME family drug/metabolite transporter